MTNIWDSYPQDYRAVEAGQIEEAARAGECCLLIGLSGAGKSNLLAYLVHRKQQGVAFLLVDCNRLSSPTETEFWKLLARQLGCPDNYEAIEVALGMRLDNPAAKLCLVLDRFDALSETVQARLAGPLRALRDAYKYQLSYTIGTRRPLAHSEMTELFYAHTLWLGLLTRPDAAWSAGQYAARKGLLWNDEILNQIVELSGGYPALLRAVCEAFAAGTPLSRDVMRESPIIQRVLDEFWQDEPSTELLSLCGLMNNPLIGQVAAEKPEVLLTAKENLLLIALRSRQGEICEKDDLIRAVWPEDRVYSNGIRDDSLAQLVRRLRKKVGEGKVQTIPGRGYRWDGGTLSP